MPVAHFRPEAWIRDYAVPVDDEGPDRWKVSPAYLAELIDGLDGDAACLYRPSYEADELRHDPAAPAWIREWQGPFSLSLLREAELDDE